MATDFTRLPLRGEQDALHVVVESPRGSTVKLKYDSKLQAFTLSRPLTRGFRYPFDWGFIPSTKGPDGDPLDALVYWDVPTWPGVVLPCRALGVLQVDQKKKNGKEGERERNDRLLLVPVNAIRSDHLNSYQDLSQREREELEHFFLAVVHFADKDARILGWGGPDAAEHMVQQYTLKED
ncbi:inorganic diphosphatase [Corallococcus exercitus]|uniref:inorganic diphosphatase n=1 Tax=Corallococcus exercitus TaxID=2316736 RepID=A0A3A8ITW3_9BACT|nr:inorganic diphosphatase [Corallococcus exercitus]NOK31851.1 inorganic diphosphatase [Corallococcus exercitus]RKG83210.1 inorganic diphosphatase [Corallococcus exercitus]